MLDHFLRDRAAARRLRANPIGSHLDSIIAPDGGGAIFSGRWCTLAGGRIDEMKK